MKHIAIWLSILCLTVSLTACGRTVDANIGGDISESTAALSTAVTTESTVLPTTTTATTTITTTAATTRAKPTTLRTTVTTVAVTTTTAAPVTVAPYTVNDPENTRGLSNVKSGFGFGVAKDGQPHSLSLANQARFDGMTGVEALALDTVSTDKRLYLTFDCGYEYQNLTGTILDTLKAKNVKAAFFVTLSYIQKNPHFVRRMIDEGHIVGNHSATHPVFPDISRTQMAEELYRVDAHLQTQFGYTSRYFRFPTGANSENALELVTSVGYKSIFWSLAYADYDTTKQVGYDQAFQTVTDRLHPGAVILLHAVSQDNAAILPAFIDYAHGQGYTFKTLDDYYTAS